MLEVNAKGTKLGHGLTLKSLKITQLKLDKEAPPSPFNILWSCP